MDRAGPDAGKVGRARRRAGEHGGSDDQSCDDNAHERAQHWNVGQILYDRVASIAGFAG
ncbi:hypothetical protein D3C83_227040 [compost metagenome]